MKIDMMIQVNPEKCLGCKSCEIACAVEHSASKDLYRALEEKPLPAARVQVEGDAEFCYPPGIVYGCGNLPVAVPLIFLPRVVVEGPIEFDTVWIGPKSKSVAVIVVGVQPEDYSIRTPQLITFVEFAVDQVGILLIAAECDIKCRLRMHDAHFCTFSGGVTFLRFALDKIGTRYGRPPFGFQNAVNRR